MALRTPPSWLQYGSHTAENDRLTQQALYSSTGVIGNSMAVSAQASPNMSVQVAPGWCSILNNLASSGGVYVGYNDASLTLAVAAADASNPRIDLVVATVADQAYAGVSNTIAFQVITGTPAAVPVVPTLPAMSVALGQISVPAGAVAIANANITDLRVPAISSAVQNPIQSVRLTANGTAIGAAGVPFGATNRPLLVAGRNYLVDIILPFTKTTTGTVTWRLNTTGTGHTFAASFSDSLDQSVSVYATSVVFASFPASASYVTATNYVTRFTGTITAGTTSRLYLDISAISAGTVTPLLGGQFTLTDLGPSATIGNIG